MKDGWKEVTDKDDTRVYESLLAQYSPNTELNECSFDMADPGDAVCLLWVQGDPAGFCTLKLKGCWIEELSEQYTMLTLDTIFVLPQYRQKGHVLSLLEELMRRQPGEDLGFSSPISSSMYAGNTVCDENLHFRLQVQICVKGGFFGGKRKLGFDIFAERDRHKPVHLKPLVSTGSTGQYEPPHSLYRADLQLTPEMYNQLRGLQKKAKDLRQDMRNLRRMSQAQAHSTRESIKDTFIKIRAILVSGNDGLRLFSGDADCMRINREEDLYKQEMLRLESDLT
ncbi:uncharacterized protein LOC113466621 [Diaphorina citri]|uniref:Uncharacterized protein LOC113466621 n=1 Tax=Diaphorina citri TaxID=121845 RepID=A0A3Q0INV4_DIACI|nr:uncharacterized protein LOC113466621 [Diaphorina citri]